MRNCGVEGCRMPVWGTCKISRVGYCKSHQYKRQDGDKRTALQKHFDKNKENKKIHSLMNYQNTVPELPLTVFFNKRMDELEPICDECGKIGLFLKEPAMRKLWKSCQAHLLPKKHFKSIATHELNAMVLGSGLSGLCHHHDDYDSSWEKASGMKIWIEVVRRFKILYPLITPSETKYIPDVLLKELSEEDIGWKDMEKRLDNE